MRCFCCRIDPGVKPIACSRNQVAWSKRETYMREFMWLASSYSDASTAPLKVFTHSDMKAPGQGGNWHLAISTWQLAISKATANHWLRKLSHVVVILSVSVRPVDFSS